MSDIIKLIDELEFEIDSVIDQLQDSKDYIKKLKRKLKIIMNTTEIIEETIIIEN